MGAYRHTVGNCSFSNVMRVLLYQCIKCILHGNLKFSSHSGFFYNASLSALLLRRPFITARHIQLRVKNGTRGVLFLPNILPKKDNRSTKKPPRSKFSTISWIVIFLKTVEAW